MQQFLQQYQDYQADEQTQKMLNQPVQDATGFNPGHEEFLKMLIQKIEAGEINVYSPETIYNRQVYDQLTEEQQEGADLAAVNLVALIRQVENLWKLDQKATFQIQNLVEAIFEKKSKFEAEYGNVYII